MLYPVEGSDEFTGKEKGFLLPRKKEKAKCIKKKLSNMKFLIEEFYLSLVLIQNFQILWMQRVGRY